MANDKIIERIYIKGKLELVSPLVIGSGLDEHTDIDLIRDWNGTPFIPGTALAGAIRHYLDEISDKNLVLTVFGKKEKESTQSLISFYDAVPVKSPEIRTRDGVKLDLETKTAENQAKYDYEIIEPGQQFHFRVEMIIREKHSFDRDRIKALLFLMLTALQDGKIAFGAKTRRGFGIVKLCDKNMLYLDMTKPEDVQRWIDFTWDFESTNNLSELKKTILQTSNPDVAEITADFEIPYSVLIRHYSDSPNDPDTIQLASNGKSVIPGTSWNGAIRHAIYQILKQLNQLDRFDELTKELFGYVDKNKKGKNNTRASKIVIRESVIQEGIPLTYTRNKVDRFTGGVVDSALFEEMPHYGGKVRLHIFIHQPETYETGLILLALKDIGNGIQAIGGDANIGRGILKSQTITVRPETIKEDNCLKALAAKLQEQK